MALSSKTKSVLKTALASSSASSEIASAIDSGFVSGMLPSGVLIDYVNKCHTEISQDGLMLTSMDTSSQANATGGFNGSGTGQKLFVSFMNYDAMPLSALSHISYVAKVVRGANNQLFLNVQVDLAGNGNSSDYALLIPKTNTSSVIGTTNTEQLFPLEDAIWQCVGGTGPANAAGKAGIPANGSGSYVTLQHILTYNPNAKLINASLLDGGQPKNGFLGAFQVVMNSSSATALRTNCLFQVNINSDVYKFGIS